MKKYYYSYSENLTNWILSNGIEKVFSDIHKSTGKIFTVFERSDKLNEILTLYGMGKNKTK